MSESISVNRVDCFVFRYPLETPVSTSFGVMNDRPMVLVRIEDKDGSFGWGEIFCNFPTVGAEHRARLVDSVLSPLITSRPFNTPEEAFDYLTEKVAVLAIQSGEPGPFAQAISGLDIALWDMKARRASQPLWRILGGSSSDIPVYASGLNPDRPEVLARELYTQGYRAFKVKVGFGDDLDRENLRNLRQTLDDSVQIMADANQAWTLDKAIESLRLLETYRLVWIEEPIRADRPWDEWVKLKENTRIPLAAGENISGTKSFNTAIQSKALSVLQPDIIKWGGLSKCISIAQKANRSGLTYCPHYLGGGIGLLASAHALAAVGGNGLLEIDANPNPLRSVFCGNLNKIVNGRANLGNMPGIGIEPDLSSIKRYQVNYGYKKLTV